MSAVICTHCSAGRPVEAGRSRCRPCLDHAALSGRRRYARLKSQHTCTKCGQRRVVPGESRCATCADRELGRDALLPRAAPEHWLEVLDGTEYGPYDDHFDAVAEASFLRLPDGAWEVTLRHPFQGTPDLADLRTPLSFEF